MMHKLKPIATTPRSPPVRGPRRKRRASMNALKHGRSSPAMKLLPGEALRRLRSRLSALESRHPTRQFSNSNSSARSPTPNGACAASPAWRPVSWCRRRSAGTGKTPSRRAAPGYDGEILLLGSAMLDRTQDFVHLARYVGHLSRRFFRAVKQLADLRRDESKAREARSSAGSYAPTHPDAYRGRYVPAQAPPPIDTPSPTAGTHRLPALQRFGPRSRSLEDERKSRARQGAGPTGRIHPNNQTNPISPNPCEIKRRLPIDQRQSRGRQPAGQRPRNTARVRTDTTVACRSVVQRCLAPGGGPMSHQPKSTKRTQSRRTPLKSTVAHALSVPYQVGRTQ